jgi:hypothetical protein
MVPIEEALSFHGTTDLHVMQEPFTHTKMGNQSIYDNPYPRFDWPQDSFNKGKYHGVNRQSQPVS